MAKAKKTDAPDSPEKSPAKSPAKTAAKKATPKKAPTKATGAKSPAAKSTKAARPAAAPASTPVIDTNLAAQSAARMLLARAAGHRPASVPQSQSSTIQHLKEQIARPKGALNNLLQSTGGQSSLPGSHLPHSHASGGHAQTRGPNVNRTGVPRRTSG